MFFTYAPYAMNKGINLNSLADKFFEKASTPDTYNEEQWKSFVESTICGNKLSNDSEYCEAVNSMNRNTRSVFNYFMNTSLSEKVNELVEEKVNINDAIYSSPDSAINNIFSDMFESAIDFNKEDTFDTELSGHSVQEGGVVNGEA